MIIKLQVNHERPLFCFYHNTFHAAGECRQQVKNLIKFVKTVKIVEFRDHIWNHNQECIQISPNMPGIGLAIPEITCEMLENFEKTNTMLLSKNQCPPRGKCYNRFMTLSMPYYPVPCYISSPSCPKADVCRPWWCHCSCVLRRIRRGTSAARVPR